MRATGCIYHMSDLDMDYEDIIDILCYYHVYTYFDFLLIFFFSCFNSNFYRNHLGLIVPWDTYEKVNTV